MDEYYQLLVIIIMFSLYCDYKYETNYMLQIFFLFGVIWMGVLTMNNSLMLIDEFAVILLSFHTILTMSYLYQNLSDIKKNKK